MKRVRRPCPICFHAMIKVIRRIGVHGHVEVWECQSCIYSELP